jgi:hypothetical protein
MNRSEVLKNYDVDPTSGIITSPGKFEGEMLYVPALWEYACEGAADFDENGVYGIILDESDHEEFPELTEAWAILMEESDTGFVNTREFEDVSVYKTACDLIEAQGADEDAI